MFGFDLEAIAIDIDDPDAVAHSCGAAARWPLAVPDANSSAIPVNRLRDQYDPAKQACRRVIE